MKYDRMEISKILGNAIDPRKPYPEIVDLICEKDTAQPKEFVYIYDVIEDTDRIYVSGFNGTVTSMNVSPDAPTALNFVDVSTPEYYIKLTDLANAKESVLARKKGTIERSLNAEEIYYVINSIASACSSEGNQISLASGETSFQPDHLVKMVDGIKDYGDGYVLLVSSQIETDILLWNWTHDKNIDVFQILEKLNINIQRIPKQTYVRDGSNTALIDATKAYLVATNTRNSVGTNPVLFVRKKLNDIELLGGVISEKGEKPERITFVSPNPMNISGTRYLAIGVTGYENIVCAVTNPKALFEFTRA